MGKKYDKGYDDGWYDGYMQGIEAGKKTVFIPQNDTGTKPFTCIMCGGMLADNFVCNNPSCPTGITQVSVNQPIYETSSVSLEDPTLSDWEKTSAERRKYWESRLDDMMNATPAPSLDDPDYEAKKDEDKDVGC